MICATKLHISRFTYLKWAQPGTLTSFIGRCSP